MSSLFGFEVVSFVELPFTYQTARTIELLGSDTFTGDYPLSPWYYLVPHQPVTVIISLKQTYDLLHHAFAAMVTSGTATVEALLFNIPQVVCYKGSPISYFIGKRLVRVPYIAMVKYMSMTKTIDTR